MRSTRPARRKAAATCPPPSTSTRVSPRSPKAWFWALNGAASVVASVLAIYIAARLSISAAFAVGGAVYVAGIVCLGLFDRLRPDG